ncbi:LLM class flavin-dependent oxidoreductase [Paenibacillus sp. TAB 01]|uniref:LLM class flavin-dependent oxidoreductase n=1 Tax=Paenibacillus sp. TAB 01 TaxID=3368988 RepID=UPI0037537FC1
MLALGVLDQSAIVTGGTPVQAMAQTIELAKLTERLGYYRFWLSEHHAADGLAGSSPEVLMAAVGAHTSRIRIGSAGILLSHYSPYKVAENVRVLEALYPGRIDVGIGRSAGGGTPVSEALRRGPAEDAESFAGKVWQLIGYLGDIGEQGWGTARLKAAPFVTTAPDPWLLGSGHYSAELAASLGAAFSYAHFIKGSAGLGAAGLYADRFRPGPLGTRPRINLCVNVVCADTEEEAERLAFPVALRMLLIERGQFGRTYLTMEEAAAYRLTEEDMAAVQAHRHNRMIAGDPEQVKRQLIQLSGDAQANELIVLTMLHDFEARKRSYELLAEAFFHTNG